MNKFQSDVSNDYDSSSSLEDDEDEFNFTSIRKKRKSTDCNLNSAKLKKATECGVKKKKEKKKEDLPLEMSRCVLHCDVDCFYCQCESILDSSKPDGAKDKRYLSNRPFAIGQKHIIVTSNYIARSRGVKKLMSKRDATNVCPELLIIDGSDLTLYRRQSRKIYLCFRQVLADISSELRTIGDRKLSDGQARFKACKGGFDEMFADITNMVAMLSDEEIKRITAKMTDSNTSDPFSDVFIYGNESSKTRLSEDQSGASVIVSHQAGTWTNSAEGCCERGDNDVTNRVVRWGSPSSRVECINRFYIASQIAGMIKSKIHEQIGFTVSIGVSVSPMLAKLASDLRKPNSMNLLYPWRSQQLINCMPLRKIPHLGSRTLKKFQLALEDYFQDKLRKFWTCNDFLKCPKQLIVSSLVAFDEKPDAVEERVEAIYLKCKGIDNTIIEDDGGLLPKTLSVENSHRRGTVVCRDELDRSLRILCDRLYELLVERRGEYDDNEILHSSPRTIRVSLCDVSQNYTRKRRSKQESFDGLIFWKLCPDKRIKCIYEAAAPLMEALILPYQEFFNIINVNLAFCNFLGRGECKSYAKSLDRHFTSMNTKIEKCPAGSGPNEGAFKSNECDNDIYIMSGADKNILAEIPSDMVAEAIEAQAIFDRSTKKKSNKGKNLITSFFSSKKQRSLS